jgi:DHA3 family macrolide efflux protein-like MFS transporter
VEHIEQHQPQWQTPFFSIWTGQQLSLVGSSLAQFALVWWLTETTGSATVLATGTLISLLPNVFLGPFVGALVDRWNRRRVMIVAASLGMAVAGPVADAFGVRIWYVMGGVACILMGIGAFFVPAIMHLEDAQKNKVTVQPFPT